MNSIYFFQSLYLPLFVFVVVRILVCVFLAILFLQSGLDKVFDYEGNLSYFKSHFAESPFKNMITLFLVIITISEVVAGAFCAAGAIQIFFTGHRLWAFAGVTLSGLIITALLLGQRLAKDYEGAANLAIYFILILIGLFSFAW